MENENINKCKEYIKNGQLEKAGEIWTNFHKKYTVSKELFDILEQFTDKEVYTITDYLRIKSYIRMGIY